MNYTTLFYWLTVADNAKLFFGCFAMIFIIIFIITNIVRVYVTIDSPGYPDKEFYTKCNKWTWFSTPFMLLFLSLWIFTPNKRDALLIVAGGSTMNFLTQDSTSKKIPHELSNFILTEIKNMAQEAEVKLNINNEKEKALEAVKSMSAPDLIEKLKTDTTLKSLILND